MKEPTIREITRYLETIAPPSLQEDYDNCGLLVGDSNATVTGALITLDITEEVIDEAIKKQTNLVIAHHPIIFRGLKKITGSNYVERSVQKAIKNDINLYAIHTNLDNIKQGVNKKICQKIGVANTRILRPKSKLSKLITFIPESDTQRVLDAMHDAGAGFIGDYDHCSFRVSGTGRFRGNESANPAVGNKLQLEEVSENRVEIIYSTHLESYIVESLLKSHPYEEVAYDLYPLQNIDPDFGSGMIGNLDNPVDPTTFLDLLKTNFNLKVLKHTRLVKDKIEKVAVCGGSGAFLIKDAIKANADIFITSDIKYHDFFETEGEIILADIGHYESEVFTKDLLHDLLKKKFSTFAVRLSETITNPVFYY